MSPENAMDLRERRGRRVLLVDDDVSVRLLLRNLLEKFAFTVSEAADGVEALEHLSDGGGDIVLSGVSMPNMDGLDLLRAIRDRKLPVHVIMMSPFDDIDTAIEAMKLGAGDYVCKPVREDEVLLKVTTACERLRLEEEEARLKAENARLKEGMAGIEIPGGIIGQSLKMRRVFRTIQKVAPYKSTVLILGESGTGKELIARALHDESTRAQGSWVPINCGAIPEHLIESELFGHAKGAFTDAQRDRGGLIEEANNGTLFLDEIGDLPVSMQVKLLRFLQEGEIRRVGENQGRQVDVRVVAATSRDIPAMVQAGTFREDLYYRLNVVTIKVPPLRQRRDDIPELVHHFLRDHGKRMGSPSVTVSKQAMQVLYDYHWPGNIRELENAMERALVLADHHVIDLADLPDRVTGMASMPHVSLFGDDLSIKKATQMIEQDLIRRSLAKTSGNRTQAARLLEISHRALLYKIKEYEIR